MSTKIFCNDRSKAPPVVIKKLTFMQKMKGKFLSFLGVPLVVVDNTLFINNKKVNKIMFSHDLEIDCLGNFGINSDKHLIFQSGWGSGGFIHLNPKLRDSKGDYNQKIEFLGFDGYIKKEFKNREENDSIIKCEEV